MRNELFLQQIMALPYSEFSLYICSNKGSLQDSVEAGVGDVMQGCGELGGRTVVNVESGLTGVRQEVEGSGI